MMFDWLFEGRLTVYVVLAIPAVILLALWARDRKRHWLFGVAGVALVLVAYFLCDRIVETRREQIARKLNLMAVAVKQKDSTVIFSHISDRFRFGLLDKAGFRKAVDAVLQRGLVDDLSVWDIKQPDDRGTVAFMAKPKGRGVPDSPGYEVRGEFVRDDDGQWRLKSFEVFKPYADSKTPLDIGAYLPGDR
jgi:hypothetical protein